MPLSVSEQMELLAANQAGGLGEVTAFITQLAVQEATTFLRTTKAVDPVTQPEADLYLRKMQAFCRRALNLDSRAVDSLVRIMYVVIDQDTTYTKAQVDGATANQVATFFEENIRKCFESASVCDLQEVNAYDAIV